MTAHLDKTLWERHWSQPEHNTPIAHPELIAAICRHLSHLVTKRILEVGAGMGGDSIALAGEGAAVVTADYLHLSVSSILRFAAARQLMIRGIVSDALALPFADNVFDLVFHQGLLEHFRPAEQMRLLLENRRVLKPGGYILVDVPQKYSEYTRHKRRLMRRGEWFAGWETEFSPVALSRLLRACGFRVAELYPRGYYGNVGRLRAIFAHEPPSGRGRFVPAVVRRLYRRVWVALERSPLALYACWSVGVVGEKLR